MDHPLAHLCVAMSNIDCEWADGLDVGRASWVVTKRQANAMDSPEYRDLLERSVAQGVNTVSCRIPADDVRQSDGHIHVRYLSITRRSSGALEVADRGTGEQPLVWR